MSRFCTAPKLRPVPNIILTPQIGHTTVPTWECHTTPNIAAADPLDETQCSRDLVRSSHMLSTRRRRPTSEQETRRTRKINCTTKKWHRHFSFAVPSLDQVCAAS